MIPCLPKYSEKAKPFHCLWWRTLEREDEEEENHEEIEEEEE
jgi:hypothetical protein